MKTITTAIKLFTGKGGDFQYLDQDGNILSQNQDTYFGEYSTGMSPYYEGKELHSFILIDKQFKAFQVGSIFVLPYGARNFGLLEDGHLARLTLEDLNKEDLIKVIRGI